MSSLSIIPKLLIGFLVNRDLVSVAILNKDLLEFIETISHLKYKKVLETFKNYISPVRLYANRIDIDKVSYLNVINNNLVIHSNNTTSYNLYLNFIYTPNTKLQIKCRKICNRGDFKQHLYNRLLLNTYKSHHNNYSVLQFYPNKIFRLLNEGEYFIYLSVHNGILKKISINKVNIKLTDNIPIKNMSIVVENTILNMFNSRVTLE